MKIVSTWAAIQCQLILITPFGVTANIGILGATIRVMAVTKDKELQGSDVLRDMVLKVSSSSNSSVRVSALSESCRLPLLVV